MDRIQEIRERIACGDKNLTSDMEFLIDQLDLADSLLKSTIAAQVTLQRSMAEKIERIADLEEEREMLHEIIGAYDDICGRHEKTARKLLDYIKSKKKKHERVAL